MLTASNTFLWFSLADLAGVAAVIAYVVFRKMRSGRVWLEVVDGADSGEKWILADEEAEIGRDAGQCRVALKHDTQTGRRHARLRLSPTRQFVLEDLGSQGGTVVNGVRIAQPVTLRNKDRIRIGQSELLFIDQR